MDIRKQILLTKDEEVILAQASKIFEDIARELEEFEDECVCVQLMDWCGRMPSKRVNNIEGIFVEVEGEE